MGTDNRVRTVFLADRQGGEALVMFRRKQPTVEVLRRRLRYATVAYLDAGGDEDGAVDTAIGAVLDHRMIKTFCFSSVGQ